MNTLSDSERLEIASDPQNALYTILCDKYNMEANAAWALAWEIADAETKKAANEAGYTWPRENEIEHDHNSIILEGFFADDLDFEDLRIKALFEKYGLDFNKCGGAGASSYEIKLDARKAGRGIVFIAGSERGSWFAGFTISKHALEVWQ